MSFIQKNLIRSLFIIMMGFFLSACSSTANRTYKTPEKAAEKTYVPATKTQRDTSKKTTVCYSKYRVKRGDTLSDIALNCQVNMRDLAKINSLKHPYRLRAGDILIIPNHSLSTQKSSSLKKKTLESAKMNWHWPVNKQVKYEYIRDAVGRHAINFYLKKGGEVRSVESGEVVYAGNAISHYGEMIVIRHDNNYLTVYAHNSVLKVNKGERVKKGQIISLSGQSGDAKKPKLYFEVRYLGRKVDARKLLRK